MPAENATSLIIGDPSPLIFLAKVDQLALVQKLFCGRCVVLDCAAAEVLSPNADPVEHRRLQTWLDSVERLTSEGSLFESTALSCSDQSSLAWAIENRADCLIADERLLRRFAQEHRIAVMGLCGIILNAAQARYLSRKAARRIIDEAVGQHGLNLSITVYQAILAHLQA